MKPFSLELKSQFVTCSQLQQLDLNLPKSYEINGDMRLGFSFTLTLDFEQLSDELKDLFRENSNKYIFVTDNVEKTLIPLSKLVGTWDWTGGNYFKGKVPYNKHNLEVFLEYFRN